MNAYKTYLAVFLTAALVSFVMTPLIRRLAIRLGALDLPDERKVHREPMPRLGGLAVFLGFCAPWAILYLLSNRVALAFKDYETLLLTLLLGGVAMLGLGIYDDLKRANALEKFSVQTVIAAILFHGGYQITTLSNPWGGSVELGWLALPASVLWMVGITNAINLLDGIDGLATGVTACIAICLAVINIAVDNVIVALLNLCLAGACLGFLPFNFFPARIFLGDTGSLFIGMVLACISILSLFKAVTAVFVAVPIILFAVPVFDTASVMIGRLYRGNPIFKADRTHVHHRLMKLGWSQRKAALILYGVTLLFGAGAALLSFQRSPRLTQYGVALICFLVLAIWVAWRRKRLK